MITPLALRSLGAGRAHPDRKTPQSRVTVLREQGRRRSCFSVGKPRFASPKLCAKKRILSTDDCEHLKV